MQELPRKHVAELIEETVNRLVGKTIQRYVDKNSKAFAANRIAGVEWELQINVLVDNLGLNPQPKPKQTFFKCFINGIKAIFRKETN